MAIGTFVWHDLMTSDIEAAKAFYGAVVGWTSTHAGPGMNDYQMFVGPRGPLGGVMVLPAEARAGGSPCHWMAYSQVGDLNGALARVRDLGGAVLKQLPIPSVGLFGICQDPQGGYFALFQPDDAEASGKGPSQAGEFSWAELATTDPAAAWDFYSGVLGWEVAMDADMGPMGTYRIFKTSDMEGQKGLGGIFGLAPGMPAVGWLHYISVDDLDAAIATAVDLGGKLLNGPMVVPGGDRVAQLMDDQGAAFALHSSPAG
jgi:predicted enzyme related to lactoylglutathione lyase